MLLQAGLIRDGLGTARHALGEIRAPKLEEKTKQKQIQHQVNTSTGFMSKVMFKDMN